MSDVEASEPVQEEKKKKKSTVKFNYIKWTRLKMKWFCFKFGPFGLTKQAFYLAEHDTSSETVLLRLRLFQTKGLSAANI